MLPIDTLKADKRYYYRTRPYYEEGTSCRLSTSLTLFTWWEFTFAVHSDVRVQKYQFQQTFRRGSDRRLVYGERICTL